jgi:hypothetical protein
MRSFRSSPAASRGLRRLLLFGTPAALGALLAFHPVSDDPDAIAWLAPQVGWWLTLHVLQLPLFGLMALAVLRLLDGLDDPAVRASRVGAWLFLVFYTAFDSLAGIAQGLVVANAAGRDAAYQAGALALLNDLNFSALAFGITGLGVIGWVTAVVAAAIAVGRAGYGRGPAVLLGLSALFAQHPPPFGPLGLAFFLGAAVWMERRGRVAAAAPAVGGVPAFAAAGR